MTHPGQRCLIVMRSAVVFLVLNLCFPTSACIWDKGTSKEGNRIRYHPKLAELRRNLQESIDTDLRVEGARMEQKLRGAKGFDERNDYAVALMYLGRAGEAVDLLEQLEKEKPGDYATAANLGTAYELAGRNREARQWIQEGIKRNSDSHYGTEWLHVKILDAKIQQEADPAYFDKHSVLNLDYRALAPQAEKIPVNGEARDVKNVTDALLFQLSERLKFVKNADPVVASLLFDYAAIEAGTGALEPARALLKMAAEYGYSASRVNSLVKSFDSAIRRSNLKIPILVSGGGLSVIAFLIVGWRRRWFGPKRRPAS